MSLRARFDSKWALDANGCWIWDAGKYQSGYGTINVGGRAKTTHRVSWELHRGPIPEGMHVLHKCDVRACVNPDHLFLGTNQDNIADSVAKGRRKGISRPSKFKGIKRGPQPMLVREFSYQKTPIEDRVLMRRERRRGWTIRKIAALHRVSYKTAYSACAQC